MKKQEKLTLQERIAKYLAAVPPAISGASGHNQTFSAACSLYNGWNLSEEDTLAWLKVYNERCEPKWSDKELAHKAAEAARSACDKPRGHLIGEQEKEQAEQAERFLGKPIASGNISATLATLKIDFFSSDTHPHAHTLSTSTRKESEINVANVAKTSKTADAIAKTESDTPQLADPSLARGDLIGPKNTSAHTPNRPQITENLVNIREVSHTFAAELPEKIATSTEKEPKKNEGLSDAELTEAHRIAAELVKLHRDGVISGPDDPQAVFYATLVRDFGASYTVKRSPSADRDASPLGASG